MKISDHSNVKSTDQEATTSHLK